MGDGVVCRNKILLLVGANSIPCMEGLLLP